MSFLESDLDLLVAEILNLLDERVPEAADAIRSADPRGRETLREAIRRVRYQYLKKLIDLRVLDLRRAAELSGDQALLEILAFIDSGVY